ncbi:minD family ATPase domain protein [Bacillus cereus G9842]|uniref:MinD family ATPase domain protein n=1 Tax=Bacillus cereus (strain G9842) TaxID=405531 RepID=B7IKT9_BACC2|nr:minD family ATPase domain protein [Bacillus cereus G9842]
MEDDIVGYFKQVERFDYITIDLDKIFLHGSCTNRNKCNFAKNIT